MEQGILIGVSSEESLQSGMVSWQGNVLANIKTYFNLDELNGIQNISGIAYFASSAHSAQKAYEIIIHSIGFNNNELVLRFAALGLLDVKSVDIRNRAQRFLRGRKILPTDKYLPYFSVVTDKEFDKLKNNVSLADELKLLTEKHDWQTIYQKMGSVEELKELPEIWNDTEVLSGFSFASAKLSETYVNLRQSFRDDVEKDKFLKQQLQYRKTTEILRKRCIELEPQNPTYYSNLGYSHYQYVRELRFPGGRRDGNPKAEAETALQLFKKALEINPHRINDNYRLGLLLTETLPKLNLFGKKSVISKELIESVNEKVIEGIAAFKSGIESYEVNFSAQPNRQKQYHKDYIKCYYDIARAYSDLIRNDWDESIFLLGLDSNIDVEDRVSFIPGDLEHVDLAIQNMTKCIQIDASNFTQVTDIEGISSCGLQNGTMEGVFKLYSLGKYYFLKYWILSGYGQRSNSEADECRDKAEQLLLAALNTDWPENKKNADKTFIAERLCRLFISKKEYDKAMEVMKPFIRKRMDYYVRYSLAAAFMLAGKFDEANQQIKLALEDDKGNKEKWLGHFLESVSDLRAGKVPESKSKLAEAISIAEKEGKKNLDTLLISQGYISVKENNRNEAVEFWKQALEINPYRVSVQKRVPGWRFPEKNSNS